jgi:hypothetical protein
MVRLNSDGQTDDEEINLNSENSEENETLRIDSIRSTRSRSTPHRKLILTFAILIFGAFLFFLLFIFGYEEIFQSSFLTISSLLSRHAFVLGPAVKNVDNWSFTLESYGTESCIRVLDIDQDGLDDVIFGLAGVEEINRLNSLNHSYNGLLMGVRGLDGKILWKIETKSEIFELNCNLIDIDKV